MRVRTPGKTRAPWLLDRERDGRGPVGPAGLVTQRYRSCRTVPGVWSARVVLAWSVSARATQVLPSVEYCHAYETRGSAEGAAGVTVPEIDGDSALDLRETQNGPGSPRRSVGAGAVERAYLMSIETVWLQSP